ncbi:MAG: histone deacetylase [Myxococcaceae bacterium]|nr:histone deacetylase [Myxococcaceae bacterium]
MTTRLWADSRFLNHVAGPMHPESPGRLRAITGLLEKAPIANTTRESPRPATREELGAVHDATHVDRVLALAGQSAQLDPDTAMSPGSAEAALLAAGAAAQATLEVLEGKAPNAFALVRPPGHHAERAHAMGFCLFNNVAVAAEAARKAGAERVLVLDWDVHHGNGTQHTFAARRDVLFMSSHQYPYYPGTGAPEEIGTGDGRGFTVNVALPGGQADADYGAVFHDVFLPIAREFCPDVVLVSAGFDPHRADPIGGMNVTERGFAAMTTAVKQLADETCKGRLVLLLEGGYDLDGLAQSVHACVEVMSGARRDEFPAGVGPATKAAIASTRAALRGAWKHVS